MGDAQSKEGEDGELATDYYLHQKNPLGYISSDEMSKTTASAEVDSAATTEVPPSNTLGDEGDTGDVGRNDARIPGADGDRRSSVSFAEGTTLGQLKGEHGMKKGGGAGGEDQGGGFFQLIEDLLFGEGGVPGGRSITDASEAEVQTDDSDAESVVPPLPPNQTGKRTSIVQTSRK
eukprot:GHVU01040580.1.p1 GENE.GHVU01040580.1~~GHVU01040580.1.p1  ORF type:complete len:176 (+),score=30.99 GHVU01040580.1:169-696(+)